MLAKHAEEYRLEYNQIRPHEAIAWNRPEEVHLGLADPKIPTLQTKENAPRDQSGPKMAPITAVRRYLDIRSVRRSHHGR